MTTPETTSFATPAEISTAAELCHISYYDVSREYRAFMRVYNKVKYGGLGLRNVTHFDSADKQEYAYCAFATGQTLYVVFRGTPNQKKIGLLSYIFQRPFFAKQPNGGKAHAKFSKSLDEIWPALEAWFVPKQGYDIASFNRIVWTGHSAGGALAVLAAARFGTERTFKSGAPEQCVVTFGQPRVGNADFWQRFRQPVTRVIYGNDIVPRLPPQMPGFSHWGRLIHVFPTRKRLVAGVNPDFRQRLKTFWRHGFRRLLAFKRDHYTKPYMQAAAFLEDQGRA